MDDMLIRRDEPKAWASDKVWDHIDHAVHTEGNRIRVGALLLPMYGPVGEDAIVPSEIIDTSDAQVLTVNERSRTDMVEISLQFGLSQTQVKGEEHLGTAVTLARRATNVLSLAEDLLIFQGDEGLQAAQSNGSGLLKRVTKTGNIGVGLLKTPGDPPPQNQVVDVELIDAGGATTDSKKTKTFGENTFAAVAKGISRLVELGHNGPYGVVLPTAVFADTYRPLPNTMITPAAAIKALVTEGETERFYRSGGLPVDKGLLVSLGGDTVERVIGIDATSEFTQVDTTLGQYRFRLFERFCVRAKDKTAFIILNFKGANGLS